MYKLLTFFTAVLLLSSHGFSQESTSFEYRHEKTPLMLAIEANDLAKVKKLVEEGADVNEHEFMLDSPLRLAVKGQHQSVVEYLISKGATDPYVICDAVQHNNTKLTKYLVNQKFLIGEAVVYAAENNNIEIVKVLTSNGAKVDFSQKRRKGLFRKYYVSPINEAVSHNNLEMVQILVNAGVPLNKAIRSALEYGKNDIVLNLSKKLEDKTWLLLEAFEHSNDPIVKKLISDGVPPNAEDKDGNSMLLIAAEMGNLGNVKKCIEEYNLYLHKKNSKGENALMKAARNGSLEVCSYLLEKGIAIDAQNNDGETALFYALEKEAESTFNFLLEKGANAKHISTEGNSLLIKAAINNNESTMDKLISMGANVLHKNKLEKDAFYYVVSKSSGFTSNSDGIQNTFIAAGADINTKGTSGESLLFKAVENGNFPRIKELIDKGADANTQNNKGQRPNCKETIIIKYLIEHGADINARDDWNNTFMCEAVEQNDLELAYYLVEKGIDLDQPCYFDEQAIIKAVKKQNLTLVKFLAGNGADVNAVGYFKKNVMDYALKEGDQEIIHYLYSKGAMTKEERNAKYKAALQLESDIKAALIAEDLQSIISMMSEHKVVILQEKVVKNIAYVAAKKGNIQMMNKLLSEEVNFDINSIVNETGQTALFIATIYTQDELVKDLLAKGSNIDHKDKNGKTALDFASKKSTKKILKTWGKN